MKIVILLVYNNGQRKNNIRKRFSMNKRGKEVFHVKSAKTERLRKSAIVSMQKLLNKDVSGKRNVQKRISNYSQP